MEKYTDLTQVFLNQNLFHGLEAVSMTSNKTLFKCKTQMAIQTPETIPPSLYNTVANGKQLPNKAAFPGPLCI